MITVPTAPTDLLTPAEVAALLYVDPKTVSRWATAGKIQSFRTPGGHRRFLRSEIVAMIAVDGAAEPRADQQPVAAQSGGHRAGRARGALTGWPLDWSPRRRSSRLGSSLSTRRRI